MDIGQILQNNNPLNSFAQGFQIGSVMRQQSALNKQREIEAAKQYQLEERAKLLQNDVAALSQTTDPFERMTGLNNVMLKYPEMADKFKTQATYYGDEVKNNAINQLLPALNALNLGNKDVAVQRLQTASEAFKNSGNTRGAGALDAYITDIQSAKDVGPLVQTGYMTLAGIIGPDKLMETLSKSQEYAQKQATLPSEIVKVQSEATVKAEEAKRAPMETTIKAEEVIQAPLKTQEQAAATSIKQTEATNAPALARLDIANKQANLDLTNKQKLVAVANAAKISAETERLTKQIAKGQYDISDPEKRFDFEKKLRDEYKSNTTDFTKTRDAYDRMTAIYDTYLKPDKSGKVTIPQGETAKTREAKQAAGDIGLIFNYMKMLDPGSTVREGEFATAANAAGVTDQARNLYNKIASGERLTPEQRAAYYGQAKDLYKKSKGRADDVQKSLTVVVDSYGLNKDNVFSVPKGTVGRVK